MTQTSLPTRVLKIDWDQAITAGKAIWVRKEQQMPVRRSQPGETMPNGEVAQSDYVTVLDDDGNALFCMQEDEFLATSEPAGHDNAIDDAPQQWLVEANAKRAFFVPVEDGPFHLDAPEAWNADQPAEKRHNGWDVQHITEIETPAGHTMRGRMVIENPAGPIHDKDATERNLYRAVKAL